MHDDHEDHEGHQHDNAKGHASGGGHSHGGHGHAHGAGANKKVLVGILCLSLLYMVAEIVGGLMSGSLALLADAGHMALDAASIALGLFAFWIARRPPNEKKTFGYYRVEILAAAANAMTLVAVSIWIIIEAVARLKNPTDVHGEMMSVVAAGGLVVNGISLVLLAKSSRESLNMRGVWMHVLTDALGSVSALLAAFFVWKFGWMMADPIISMVIALLILVGGWKLLRDCIDVLLVAVPEGMDPAAIRRDIQSLPGVSEVHDLHIWSMNTGVNSLSAHIRLSPTGDFAEVLKVATAMLRDKYHLEHATLQLEPDSFSHGGTHFCAAGKPFHTHS